MCPSTKATTNPSWYPTKTSPSWTAPCCWLLATMDSFVGFAWLLVSPSGSTSSFCRYGRARNPPKGFDPRHGSGDPHHRAVGDLLEDKAVPCGPIHDIGQALDEAQVKACGLVVNQFVAIVANASIGIH